MTFLLNMVIKLLYILFWFIGLVVFSFLIIEVLKSRDNLSYIAPLAILISAFLASMSVQLSIQNTQKIEIVKKEDEKIKNYLHLQYLLISLRNEIESYKISYRNIDKHMEDCQEKLMAKFSYNDALKQDTNTLLNRLKSLEDANLFSTINSELYNHIINICLFLSNINQVNTIIINHKEINIEDWKYHYEHIEGFVYIIRESINSVESFLTKELPKQYILDSSYRDILTN